ncbi:unnamed protein product [Protopolystoma xenopodis]|uniref:Uncharacterized protein n=1 Tax=Protopolystoma xenopodis TaxID=117903 RepID=A0A3S5BKC7_9PLAT|nr:unnamed protein product [Protopolystoma xenopodis]
MFVSKTRQYISSNKHPFASVVGSISSGSQPFLYRDDANTSRETSLSSSGGLIALLVGRLTGSDASSPRVSQHLRDLGKIVELVNTAISLHKCLVDHDDVRGATSQEAPLDPLAVREQNSFGLSHHDKNQCETGNKLATLSADVLLAAVSSLLAGFDCPQVDGSLIGYFHDRLLIYSPEP